MLFCLLTFLLCTEFCIFFIPSEVEDGGDEIIQRETATFPKENDSLNRML